MKYCQNLKFEQNPNYYFLRSLFINILSNMNLDYKKLTFDWIKEDNKELLGIPRKNLKRKETPQSRLLKSIEKYRTERIKRQNKSEVNLKQNIKIFDLYNNDNSEIKFKSNIYSEKINFGENNNKDKMSLINTFKEEKKKINNNIEKKPQNNIKVIIIKNNSNYYVNNINKKNSSQDRVIKTNYIKDNKKFINIDNTNMNLRKNKRRKIPIPSIKILNSVNNINTNIIHNFQKNNSYRRDRSTNLTDFNLSNIVLNTNNDSKIKFSKNNIYQSPLFKYNINKNDFYIIKEKANSQRYNIMNINNALQNKKMLNNSYNNYISKNIIIIIKLIL